MASDMNFMFCRFRDNDYFEEAYNLVKDPLELKNIAYEILPDIRVKYTNVIDHMKHCVGEQCHKIY